MGWVPIEVGLAEALMTQPVSLTLVVDCSVVPMFTTMATPKQQYQPNNINQAKPGLEGYPSGYSVAMGLNFLLQFFAYGAFQVVRFISYLGSQFLRAHVTVLHGAACHRA